MSAAVHSLPETAPSHGGTSGRDLNHVSCCRDDDTALCGSDISEHTWCSAAAIDCRVCLDLDDLECGHWCPVLRRLRDAH